MRCITAIWPAGPPKLSAATRAQTRTASPKPIPCTAGTAPATPSVAVSVRAIRRLPASAPSVPVLQEPRAEVLEDGATALQALGVVVGRGGDAVDQGSDAG